MPNPRIGSESGSARRRSESATTRVVYLVRHAIAAERGPDWPDDDLRPLTERGTERFRKTAAGFASLKIAVDEVWTSPLVRARQTAELLAGAFSDQPPVKVLTALAPGHAPSRVVEEVTRVTRKRRIVLVGHEPGLGELAAFLVGARRAIPFRKGGVCRIDVEITSGRWSGTLVWLSPPRILRRLVS